MHRQFSIPGIKTSDRYIKTVASSTAGAIEATPNCTYVYLHPMCMGTCGISWIFPLRWRQWIDGRRTLLGTDAFRDRYVALNFVIFHSFDAIWTSNVRPRLLETQLCLTLPSM